MNNIPEDWDKPEWHIDDRVHNWRNYASKELIEIWGTFTETQKKVISSSLQDTAGAEYWN